MVIIATLIVLFIIFFFIRHHIGPAHLAMIAGLSVYEMFGTNFADWVHKLLENVPLEYIQSGVYVALVLVFPLILYIHSSRGGLYGLLRIAEAGIFAAILTALLSATLAKYLPFDALATQISTFISSIKGPLVLVGVLSAYLDIMLYHN